MNRPPHVRIINKDKMLDIMAVEALSHFVTGFDNGGHMTDKSIDGWKERKRHYNHPILLKTGQTSDSLRTLERGSNYVIVGSTYKVAGFHNNGTGRLPVREIVGASKPLEAKLLKILLKSLKNGR